LKIKSDEFIPADLLLLNSSGTKGSCFVETKGLDGETNLKIKSTTKEFRSIFKNKTVISNIVLMINCEKPNNAIYKFEGQIKLGDSQFNLPNNEIVEG